MWKFLKIYAFVYKFIVRLQQIPWTPRSHYHVHELYIFTEAFEKSCDICKLITWLWFHQFYKFCPYRIAKFWRDIGLDLATLLQKPKFIYVLHKLPLIGMLILNFECLVTFFLLLLFVYPFLIIKSHL